jgi:hypothetical protein
MKPLAFSRLEAARKRLLGLLRMASPLATTPNPDFEKAINRGTTFTMDWLGVFTPGSLLPSLAGMKIFRASGFVKAWRIGFYFSF